MHRQRRTQYNAIHAASLARWIILFAFVAVAGLIYVYLTVQLNHLGDKKKALEKELTIARVQIVEAAGQIATLKSRSALERRMKEGYLKMVPIAEQNIVHLSPSTGRPNEDGVQPVVNQRAGR